MLYFGAQNAEPLEQGICEFCGYVYPFITWELFNSARLIASETDQSQRKPTTCNLKTRESVQCIVFSIVIGWKRVLRHKSESVAKECRRMIGKQVLKHLDVEKDTHPVSTTNDFKLTHHLGLRAKLFDVLIQLRITRQKNKPVTEISQILFKRVYKRLIEC